jgi:hypothetical protein
MLIPRTLKIWGLSVTGSDAPTESVCQGNGGLPLHPKITSALVLHLDKRGMNAIIDGYS